MVPSIQNLYTTVFKYHVMQGPVLPLFLCVEVSKPAFSPYLSPRGERQRLTEHLLFF